MGEAPLFLFFMPVFFCDPAIGFELIQASQTFAISKIGELRQYACVRAESAPCVLANRLLVDTDAREHVAAEWTHLESFDFGA
jgi:hypothetical protein